MIYRVLIGLALTGGLFGYIYIQHLQIEAAEVRAQQAENKLVDAKTTITELRDREVRHARLQRQASILQADLERAASDRETEIRRLQRENNDLREWADARLPDAVIGMRRRTAITGAEAYRQRLSNAEPVHAAVGGAGDQRRTESADRTD